MRQNTGPIRALAGFKRLIRVIKYQQLMPDPFDHSVSQVQRKPPHPDRADAFSRVEKYRPNLSPGRNADVLVGISNSQR